MIAVTGVSGSGKSTLVNGILKKKIAAAKTRPMVGDSGPMSKIKDTIENVVVSSATSAELASPYKGFV